MGSKVAWDAELYEAKHGFVWQFGESLIQLLNPQPGEHVLDLGCGPGQLTNSLAEEGAVVLGLDSSPEMIGQARQNFPKLHFTLQDATAMQFDEEFDAIFSNAALHWILDASGAARAMAKALRKQGRFVAELGGKGNIRRIVSAIHATLVERKQSVPAARTYFPSLGEYSYLLEQAGFEVHFAHLFDRPTPLDGPHGMRDWLRQFGWYFFEGLPVNEREQALHETVERLRPELCEDGVWAADYRRLRIVAHKSA